MRPDRDRDWVARTEALTKQETVRRKPELLGIKRAALSAESVTGDPHWDLFLSIVNERIKDLQGQLNVAMESLKTSDEFTTSELINQKLAVRLAGKQIEALEWVVKLPAQLMEQGDQSKQLLESIDETSD